MKTLKIIPPSLPSNVLVASTSWFINTKEDFSGTVLLEKLNSTTDLFSLTLAFDITDRVYAKAEMNLSNGNTERSDIIQLVPNADNKPSSLFVYAPKVSHIISSYDKHMVVSIPEPKMFYNTSRHVSTTWKLVDASGVSFYERDRDVDNMLSIIIDERIYASKNAFTIEAIYNFEDVSIDVIGRGNVLLNIRKSDISLSVSSLSADRDNLISVLGIEYDVVRIDITYSVGGAISEVISLERGISDSFTITAPELVGSNEIVFSITTYTLNGTLHDTVTLPISSFNLSAVKLMTSTASLLSIETTNNPYGNKGTITPVVNGSFVSNTETERVNYDISNDVLVETSREVKSYDSYFMSSDTDLYARSSGSVFRLDPLTLNATSTVITPISTPGTGLGLSDYKGSLFVLDGNAIEHEIDLSTDTVIATVSRPFDYFIRITDTLTFTGSVLGDYAFSGNIASSLPNTYERVNYVRTPKGVLAVAFAIDRADLFYINSTGHSIVGSIPIGNHLEAIAAYDVSVNKIYIINKI